MSDLTPADLAKFVHLVPVGATIPAGTEFCYRTSTGSITGPLTRSMVVSLLGLDERKGYWTAEPIAAPLPAAPGSVIAKVAIQRGREVAFDHLEFNFREARWFGTDAEEGHLWTNIRSSEIQSWAPACVVIEAQS